MGEFYAEEIYEHTRRCPNCHCDEELQEQIHIHGETKEKVKFCSNCHKTFWLFRIGGINGSED